MSAATSNPDNVVGIRPWLPWPLASWAWWTEPVRAERLAALRIGLGICLLFDIGSHYAPEVMTYFSNGRLGDPEIFNWRFQSPRTTWSLLRGLGDPPAFNLALSIWIATTLWILGNSLARILLARRASLPDDRTGVALGLWSISFAWYVGGIWATMVEANKIEPLAWVMPVTGYSLACLFFALDLLQRLLNTSHQLAWRSAVFSFLVVGALLGVGILLTRTGRALDQDAWWLPLFRSWQDDENLLATAMCLWIGSAALLLVGFCTRWAAVATWVFSMSFANANPYLDNAGDTIRLMLLFYLMLCPSGAAWSVDATFSRRSGTVYVYPWALRLIFVQMIFIYCMNGYYKLFGPTWIAGNSLCYVLGDVALTRFSPETLPIPFVITRMMTWSVLLWETTFPLLVLFTWPRRIALIFGVLFHLGIFATMELGGFVPYALCMYLPLVPWEALRSSGELSKEPRTQ